MSSFRLSGRALRIMDVFGPHGNIVAASGLLRLVAEIVEEEGDGVKPQHVVMLPVFTHVVEDVFPRPGWLLSESCPSALRVTPSRSAACLISCFF